MNKKTRFYQLIKIIGIGIFSFLFSISVIVANTKAQVVELQLTISPAEIPPELLFGINLTIPQEYKKIKAEESILADIRLLNSSPGVSPETKTDISIDYSIKDAQENVILSDKEKRTIIGKEESFSKKFKTPSDIKPGPYTLYAKMTYNEKEVATSSDNFEIISKIKWLGYWKWLLLSVLIVSFCYWILSKRGKH
jgi:hypothetical protein